MRVHHLHPWRVSREEAQALQKRFAAQVLRLNSLAAPPRLIAGVDLSPPDADGLVQGAAVVLSFPGLEIQEVATAKTRPLMPYFPGLLAFREAPPLAAALEKLALTPDLIMMDGQGIAHPRRFGIACHLGLLTDLPAIGCAKSRLCGEDRIPPPAAGSWVELVDRGEVIGAIVRSKDNVAPLYVSIGHRVDLPTAISLTLACCKGFRMPEPTRLAHLAAAGQVAPPPQPRRHPSLPQQARLL